MGRSHKVETHRDDFDGFTRYLAPGNKVGSGLWFNPVHVDTDEGAEFDLVQIVWRGSDWTFIDRVVLLLDGERMELSCSDSTGDVEASVYAVVTQETMWCELPLGFWEQLIAHSEVRIKVSGDNGYVEGNFDPDNFTIIRTFLRATGVEIEEPCTPCLCAELNQKQCDESPCCVWKTGYGCACIR